MAAVSAPNTLKELFKADKVALGMNVRLARSGDIARIAKTTGHDFIFIDGQHSLFKVETIGHIAQTALGDRHRAARARAQLRRPEHAGAARQRRDRHRLPGREQRGRSEARGNRAKFPPIGRRSVGGGYPIFDFRPINPADAVPALNDNTLVVCMIETREGLENVDAIAAVDGVDVIHVGSNDLLTALGKPGTYGSPEHTRRARPRHRGGEEARQSSRRRRRSQLARQVGFHPQGRAFITTNSEIAFMLAEGSRVTGELRKALA